ncbi:MAG: helix-turn-helix transcriptional regulator [Chloroflexi bacterium]|nr:helix-turn-helix transcriptional regulator [Chloroflexota bacterium]
MDFRDDEPCYVISVVAKMVNLHPQTLRYYERVGLIKPSRTSGRIRLYSQADVEDLRKIARITEELGVKNLAGVEVIINMTERIEELQRQMAEQEKRYQAEIEQLQQQLDMYHNLVRRYGPFDRLAGTTGFLLGPQTDQDTETG